MWSCRDARGPSGVMPLPSTSTPRMHLTAHGGLSQDRRADVTVLEVERLLRRLAIRRTGRSQVETAFAPAHLPPLRALLTLAVQARGRSIAPRRPALPS